MPARGKFLSGGKIVMMLLMLLFNLRRHLSRDEKFHSLFRAGNPLCRDCIKMYATR